MEKNVRTYDLEAIKSAFSDVKLLRVSASGLKGARAIGFSRQDMVDAIQAIKRSDFFKSMTTYANHRVWQVCLLF